MSKWDMTPSGKQYHADYQRQIYSTNFPPHEFVKSTCCGVQAIL